LYLEREHKYLTLNYSETLILQIHILTIKKSGGFQVIGVGTVGVTTTARVDLSVTENTPKDLYYN